MAVALFYAICNASDPLQTGWSVGGSTVTRGGLCVTASAGFSAPLALRACSGEASQTWAYVSGVFANNDVAWNGQETAACTFSPPALGAGCKVASWPLPGGGWNGLFDVDSPSQGMIQGRFATSGGPSPSGLCVSAVPPPPPPPLAVPTTDVLAWSRKEIMCLYDIDMCTYVVSLRSTSRTKNPRSQKTNPNTNPPNRYSPSMLQGCDCARPPPPVSTWAPTALDTDSWIAAGVSAGCQVHILVAKHMCGFVSWNSTAGSELGYNYSSIYSSTPVDVVAPFVASVQKVKGAVGMYYSLTNNARTNTCAGNILPNPRAGQIAVTPAQYDGLVREHLTELWGNYGPLSEVWFVRGAPPCPSPPPPRHVAVALTRTLAHLSPRLGRRLHSVAA
jgi:hypothetical protein